MAHAGECYCHFRIDLSCTLVIVQYRDIRTWPICSKPAFIYFLARKLCDSCKLRTFVLILLYFHLCYRQLTLTRLTWVIFRLTGALYKVKCSAVNSAVQAALCKCHTGSDFLDAIYKRKDLYFFSSSKKWIFGGLEGLNNFSDLRFSRFNGKQHED